MKTYIRATGAVTPQNTFNDELFENNEIVEINDSSLRCIEPDYKEIINPAMIRRMSRVVKMGVAASMKALNTAGILNPDAIITGTALGCMEDTGNFLSTIIKNNEQFLTPTAFIQSTHNTISAQIALLLKCNNYNYAYVHRGFSFENALLDAMMLINDGDAGTVLVGGIDEITPEYFEITKRMGFWKSNAENITDLFSDPYRGCIAGEGSVFFALQNNKDNAFACFEDVDMIFTPSDYTVVKGRINAMLTRSCLQLTDIDAVVVGMNGWNKYDRLYKPLLDDMFADTPVYTFKHLSGEYMTASSFAAWLAANMIKYGKSPVKSLNTINPEKFSNILIYNHYMGIEHTLMLLSAC